MPAPQGQALALALFEVAAADDGPAGVAGEHAPARLDLIVDVEDAGQACQPTTDFDERLESPRIDLLAVTGLDKAVILEKARDPPVDR